MPHIPVEPEGVTKVLSSHNPNKAASLKHISSCLEAGELYRPLPAVLENSLNSTISNYIWIADKHKKDGDDAPAISRY